MVSAMVDGVLKFYRITPTGTKVLLTSGATKYLGPSGSSEGIIASTPEKWANLPALGSSAKVLQVNDKLQVTFTPVAAVTVDASDAAWVIPITLADGTADSLNGPSDANSWDSFVLGDVALIAAREYPVCEKVIRAPFALGGGKIFASIENNA
jgi:hypothetical protein